MGPSTEPWGTPQYTYQYHSITFPWQLHMPGMITVDINIYVDIHFVHPKTYFFSFCHSPNFCDIHFIVPLNLVALTATFPGGSRLAGTRMSPFWTLLELRVMEVVSTTGARRRAKLQSNRRHQQTNTQLFTGRMPFLSRNQQCKSTEGKIRGLSECIV